MPPTTIRMPKALAYHVVHCLAGSPFDLVALVIDCPMAEVQRDWTDCAPHTYVYRAAALLPFQICDFVRSLRNKKALPPCSKKCLARNARSKRCQQTEICDTRFRHLVEPQSLDLRVYFAPPPVLLDSAEIQKVKRRLAPLSAPRQSW